MGRRWWGGLSYDVRKSQYWGKGRGGEEEGDGEGRDGGQSTLQPWAGGAVVSAPILVGGGQRFESSLVHFFSLLSGRG